MAANPWLPHPHWYKTPHFFGESDTSVIRSELAELD